MASGEDSIFDHCSTSWTIDEAFSSLGAKNITLQRSLISEALNEAGHEKYPAGTQHGYAAGTGKNPFVLIGRLDIFNNVVCNWRSRTTDFDTGKDGMPDAREKAHGLDPSRAEDGNGTDLSDAGLLSFPVPPAWRPGRFLARLASGGEKRELSITLGP